MTGARAADAPAEPPRVPAGIVPRTRLAARLDGPWDALVVEGPAGSGKTVLMADWSRRAGVPVRWIEADGVDAAAISALLGEPDAGIVVVDRAERLASDSLAALGAALDRGTTARLVLLTRTSRTAKDLLAATGQRVAVLAPAELLVDDEELAALLPGRPAAAIGQIAGATGRLMAAVRDAAEGDDGAALERFRARLLAEIEHRPAGYRDALARLAIVQSMDAAIAARLGIDPGHLPLAAEDGLGTLADGWLDTTAFAARALAPLGEAIPPETRDGLVRAALGDPELCAERPYEALRLAIAARDFDAATDVILQHGLAIVDEPDRARRALAGVGYAQIKHHPLLIIVMAQLANLDRSTRIHGLVLFGRAITAIRTGMSNARPREAIGFRAFAATLVRFTPAADQALKQSVRALAELERLDELELGALEVVGAQVLTHVGLTAMAGGDDALAATMYERAYGVLLDLDSREMLDPLSLRAALAAYRGELPLARELVDTALAADWPRNWRTGLRGQGLELALAVLDIEACDPAGALAHLTATGPIGDLLEHWSLFAAVQGWRDLLAGEHVQGLARIRDIRAHRARTPTTSVARARLDAAEALLLLASGDPAGARVLAASAAKHVPEGTLELARAQFALGRTGEAGATLARLARQRPAPRVALGAELLAATIALRGGDPTAGDAVCLRIGDLARSTGVRLAFLSLPEQDRALIRASALRVGDEELAELVATVRPVAPVAALGMPRLTAREQAVLAALVDTSSTAEIAARLFVSANTVKTQLRSLYRKLGVGTREQARSRAIALGLVGERDEEAG